MAVVINGTTGITNSGTEQVATTIGVGGATPANTGAGITFPATQSASSDANTLDDYEEGTWTPTLSGSGSSPTGVTYVAQAGYYTKVGRLVMANFVLGFTTYTGGSGTFKIAGLPFTVANLLNTATVGSTQIEYVDLTAGYTYALVRALQTEAALDFQEQGDNTVWRGISLTQVASSATQKYVNATIVFNAA